MPIDQANDFLDRFCHYKPSDELQTRATFANANTAYSQRKTESEYSLGIAAAGTGQFPYEMHERIVHEAKGVLAKAI